MKIPKRHKIELIASNDKSREVLQHLQLKGDRLSATNGRMLVSVRVELDPKDRDGLIPVKALRAARQGAGRFDTYTLAARRHAITTDGIHFPRPKGNYPNWEGVVPTEPVEHRICLNAKFLYEIAHALGDNEVMLSFRGDKAIYIEPVKYHDEKGFGVLMPVSIRR